MKPYVIYFNGDFLGGSELRHDGKGIAQDTREALRFETREEADAYIEEHRVELEHIGSDPKPLWTMPTGHTHQ